MRGGFKNGYPVIRGWLSPAYTTPALFNFKGDKTASDLTRRLWPVCLICLDFSWKKNGIPYGIRTRVAAVKGRCPKPLDERDAVVSDDVLT